MSEVLLPTWIVPEKETHDWLDEGTSVFPATFAPGLAQRQSYGGLRLKLSRQHTVRGEEKAQLLSILKATRGRFNVLRTKVHFALRGTFPATELIANNTFANGTTSWSVGSSANIALSEDDRVLRVTRVGAVASTTARAAVLTTTAYVPYVARAMIVDGRGPMGHGARIATAAGGNDVATTGTLTVQGLATAAGVSQGTSTFFNILDNITGKIAGDFMDVPYTSTAQCALVDNGLNSLLRSDQLGTTWTATRSSVVNNPVNAPDGTATADAIIEDATAANSHFVSQNVTVAAAVGDYAFAVALKAGTRTWAYLLMQETSGSTNAIGWINLATGAVGSISTGANWANVRIFSNSLGDGWYAFNVVAQKTNAATTIQCRIALATADSVATYSGDGASLIYGWRATLAQSGVPTQLIGTVASASTGTSQTGNALNVKGLPASTNSLLLPGDWIEIGGELKQCSAALNSDAAGLGYLQFEPALVRSPADSDPVIVLDPMGKFLVSNIKIDNEFGTQAVVTYDLEHVYE